jgi:hypothetical protein
MSSGSFGYPISSEDETNRVAATSSQSRRLQKENVELKDVRIFLHYVYRPEH